MGRRRFTGCIVSVVLGGATTRRVGRRLEEVRVRVRVLEPLVVGLGRGWFKSGGLRGGWADG